jgi:GT2 family glycosyltransferase
LSAIDVSIVIPTFARPDGLRACLDGISRMRFDMSRIEVIVVDDGGGPDAVAPVVAGFRDRLTIHTLKKPNGGPASARNAGAGVARGRFLAFIDDDCVPLPEWIGSLMVVLENQHGALTGGPVINGLPDDPYAAASQRIATYVAGHYAEGRGGERFFTTNNFALSAERFRELGGFDETIPGWTAEDKEFCDRWRDRDYPMVWVPGAPVHHAHALTLRRFVRQHFDYGRGICAFRLKRKPSKGKRLVPEPAGFYSSLILHPLRRERNARAVRAVLLLALSQAATIAGAVSAAVVDSPRKRIDQRVVPQPGSPVEGA